MAGDEETTSKASAAAALAAANAPNTLGDAIALTAAGLGPENKKRSGVLAEAIFNKGVEDKPLVERSFIKFAQDATGLTKMVNQRKKLSLAITNPALYITEVNEEMIKLERTVLAMFSTIYAQLDGLPESERVSQSVDVADKTRAALMKRIEQTYGGQEVADKAENRLRGAFASS